MYLFSLVPVLSPRLPPIWNSIFVLFQRRPRDNGVFQEQFQNNKNNDGMILQRNMRWHRDNPSYTTSKVITSQWKWSTKRTQNLSWSLVQSSILSISYFSDKRSVFQSREDLPLLCLKLVKWNWTALAGSSLLVILLATGRDAGTPRWMLTEDTWLHLFLTGEQMEELLMWEDWELSRGRRRRRWTPRTKWS